MVVIEAPDQDRSAPPDPEAVIREARRRQRRRWMLYTTAAVVAGTLVATAVAVFSGTPLHGSPLHPPHHTTPPPSPTRSTPGLPTATGVKPEAPGALAVAPDGGLYIADDQRNEILERLPNGAFRVIAGNGTAGFSGDGGPATSAEIDDPGGIAMAAAGTLYFADVENARVRAVSPTGTITTVVGNGQRGPWVANGTPALTASLLSPTAVTLSPSGQLYIANGQQVLALRPNGTLTNVLGHQGPLQGLPTSGTLADDASADGATCLAFDRSGDLFVAGVATKNILMVNPQGIVTVLPGTLYPRGYGGLVTAPDGTVLAINTLSVVKLTPDGGKTVITFPSGRKPPDTFLGVRNFSPTGIATAPDGTIYVDTNPDGGFADTSAIASITPTGRPSLLWRQIGDR